jgi:hypothetical protein
MLHPKFQTRHLEFRMPYLKFPTRRLRGVLAQRKRRVLLFNLLPLPSIDNAAMPEFFLCLPTPCRKRMIHFMR